MKKILLLLGIIIAATACKQDDNRIFEESSTLRVREVLAECAAAVTDAEFGWKMLYMPAPSEYGGYTVVIDFIDDKNVRMKGDFWVTLYNIEDGTYSNVETESESTYSFNASQGPVLSFDTKSVIHQLSDPSVAPQGIGLKGEFEFVIDRITPDSLVFTGKKYGHRIVMHKATEEDWANMDIQRRNLESLAPETNASFFRSLSMNQTAANFTYVPDTRTVNYIYTDDVDKKIHTGKAGVYGTVDGVKFLPKIKVGGVVVDGLKYNPEANSFEVASQGVMGRLQYSDEPPFPFWNSIDQMQRGSNIAGLPVMPDLDPSNIGGLLGSFLSLFTIGAYVSPELSGGSYSSLALAGMKQFRLIWELDNTDGEILGPDDGAAWMSFYGDQSMFSIFDPNQGVSDKYSVDYRLKATVLREQGDQIKFELVPAVPLPVEVTGDDRLVNNIRLQPNTTPAMIENALSFQTNMENTVGFNAFMNFITDSNGFTVVPESDMVYTLVNRGDSRRWMRLTKE